jgi:BirA family biotin operon repressor/biotin-[acetyl-CoA-carboxylase] ligase
MNIVKLDAIDSTNDYLKGLLRKHIAEDFTVVTAELQTKGKGQRGSTWTSEKGKNIIMSLLVKDFVKGTCSLFDINIVASLAVYRALQSLKIPKLAIKWPNDIMSDNKKIGGILVENIFKGDNAIDSIVGIGLNVNQTAFESLPQASSLSLILNHSLDKDKLLLQIASSIEETVKSWEDNAEQLRETYIDLLFRKDMPTVFEISENSSFCGTIRGITWSGRLEIEDENGQLLNFDVKEVKMIF